VRGAEAYEAKKTEKLRCLLFRRKKKNIYLLFMKSLLKKKKKTGRLLLLTIDKVKRHDRQSQRPAPVRHVITAGLQIGVSAPR
jgi:hypothetical protein